MKILFITQFYPPEMGAAATRIAGLARNLKSFGHEVTVLTGFPNYPSGEIGKKYRYKFFSCSSEIDGVNIKRVWVFASPKRKFYTRLINYFSLIFTATLFELFDKSKYDVVFTTSPPLFLGIAGYLISKIKKAVFVFDIRDLWPKFGVDSGNLAKNTIYVRLAERLEDFLYKKAEVITVTTNGKYEYLNEVKGIAGTKIKVLPNGVDKEFLDLKTDNDIKTKFFNNGTFTVLYAGLIGIAQGVDVIVKAANILKEKRDIKFYIVGEGVEKCPIQELAKELGLESIFFVKNLPKEKIATFLRNADLTIIPLKKASFTESVPSKLLESLAFKCPVILSASGESTTIVEQANGGIITSPGNEEELAVAILKLYENLGLKMQFRTNKTKYIENNFMRDKIAKDLEEIFSYLCSR